MTKTLAIITVMLGVLALSAPAQAHHWRHHRHHHKDTGAIHMNGPDTPPPHKS